MLQLQLQLQFFTVLTIHFLLLTVGGQVGNWCVVAFPRPWVGGVVRR